MQNNLAAYLQGIYILHILYVKIMNNLNSSSHYYDNNASHLNKHTERHTEREKMQG